MAKIKYCLMIVLIIFGFHPLVSWNWRHKIYGVDILNRIVPNIVFMKASKSECIDDLSMFREALEEGSTSTIVLCPKSIFDMDGSDPLPLRSDTTILCGANGSLSNRCVIYGGTTHFSSKCSIVNTFIKGVTMASATDTVVILQYSGDVTFENCIFQNSANTVVRIVYKPTFNISLFGEAVEKANDKVTEFWKSMKNWVTYDDGLRRHQKASFNATISSRSSVAKNRSVFPRLAVRFAGCVFQGNSVVSSTTQTSIGMILVDSRNTDVIIWDTLFLENDYGSFVHNGYAALISDGSSVNLRNNCFLNNHFAGIGPIIVHTKEVVLPIPSQTINNGGIQNGPTTCEFLALIPTDSFKDCLFNSVSCLNYDGVGSECAARSFIYQNDQF